tara:strand:- start:2091 stop:2516 length:426 start_codon:yes stop_codon:yes gene_type:complete
MSEELHLGQPEISDEDPNSHIKIKEELYDHGSITKRDQLVVEECLKFIDPGLHDEVKEKFEMKTRPIYEVKNHPMWKILKELNIFPALQGYDFSSETGSTRYPIYAICEDFRKLEKLYEAIAQKVANEFRPHLKSNGSDTK